MVLKLLRVCLIGAIVVAAGTGVVDSPRALARGPGVYTGDLFYNYYAPPDPYWGLGAQLYICPRPTPPLVGHTYITYQPLMPHEFLYQHHRTYYRYHPQGGVTKVHVGWQ